jgi:hypothetical protein
MDIDELIAYLLSPVAQISLIIGLAELAKRIGLPHRYIPILDLVLGLISGICVYGLVLGYGPVQGIPLGIAMGLSACGLFSGVKNVLDVGDQSEDGEE